MLENPAPRRPPTTGERLGAFFFGALVFGLFLADLLSPYEARKLAFPLMIAFWVPALVVHECGHALVAKLVGWRVTEMVLGFGPELTRFHIGETRVVVRAIIMEGYVVPSPRVPEIARMKSALVFAGGPGAELLVAALIAASWGWQPFFVHSEALPLIASQSAALALVVGALMTLIPHAQSGSASDGLGILLSANMSEEHFLWRVAIPTTRLVDEALAAGDAETALTIATSALALNPRNAHIEMLRIRALAEDGEADAAIAALEALRECAARHPLVESELLHTAAQIALADRDTQLLGNAAHAVRSAIQTGGPQPAYHATLGALLCELGRAEESFAALQDAYKSSRNPLIEDRCIMYLTRVTKMLKRDEDHARFARELKRRSRRSANSRSAPPDI